MPFVDHTDARYAQPLLPVLHLLDSRLNEYSGILVTFERLSAADLARLIALGLTENGLHDDLIAVATWMNDPKYLGRFPSILRGQPGLNRTATDKDTESASNDPFQGPLPRL